MVTWTAIASGILQHPRQRHTGQRPQKAQDVITQYIGAEQQPLSLLEVSHGFEGVAGEGGESAAEADHDQKAPPGIDEHALACPDHEEADDQAATYVNEKGPVGKDRPQGSGGET